MGRVVGCSANPCVFVFNGMVGRCGYRVLCFDGDYIFMAQFSPKLISKTCLIESRRDMIFTALYPTTRS